MTFLFTDDKYIIALEIVKRRDLENIQDYIIPLPFPVFNKFLILLSPRVVFKLDS